MGAERHGTSRRPQGALIGWDEKAEGARVCVCKWRRTGSHRPAWTCPATMTAGGEYYRLSWWLPAGVYAHVRGPCRRWLRRRTCATGTSMLGLDNATNAASTVQSIMRAFADLEVIA